PRRASLDRDGLRREEARRRRTHARDPRGRELARESFARAYERRVARRSSGGADRTARPARTVDMNRRVVLGGLAIVVLLVGVWMVSSLRWSSRGHDAGSPVSAPLEERTAETLSEPSERNSPSSAERQSESTRVDPASSEARAERTSASRAAEI